MHKRLMDPVLASLDPERSAYFSDVAMRISEDARASRNGNLIFAFLAAAAPYLPTKLRKDELIGRLFVFVERNEHRLMSHLFDPRYLSDRDLIKPVVGEFVAETTALLLKKLDAGEVDEETGTSVYRLSWPYDAAAFPYADDDENDG